MSLSRVELLRADLITEFEAIKTSAGYRSSVVLPIADVVLDPARITDSPRICVIFGPESIPVQNSTKEIFNSQVPVMVIGYVKVSTGLPGENRVMSESADALLHDMKRVMAGLMLKYKGASNRWFVLNEPRPTATRFSVPQSNIGWVSLEFTVQVFAQNGDF